MTASHSVAAPGNEIRIGLHDRARSLAGLPSGGPIHPPDTDGIAVPSTRSFYHDEGMPMKRFVLFFASLVLSIQVIGCGGDASTSNPAADDPSKWGEAKKSQAKRDADIAERVKAAATKKGR